MRREKVEFRIGLKRRLDPCLKHAGIREKGEVRNGLTVRRFDGMSERYIIRTVGQAPPYKTKQRYTML